MVTVNMKNKGVGPGVTIWPCIIQFLVRMTGAVTSQESTFVKSTCLTANHHRLSSWLWKQLSELPSPSLALPSILSQLYTSTLLFVILLNPSSTPSSLFTKMQVKYEKQTKTKLFLSIEEVSNSLT